MAVAVFASFAAFAQQEDPEAARERELKEGLRYVKGLQQYLFADIADLVLKELTVKFPEAKAKLAVLELEGELARGKFDDVKARIAREPNQNSPGLMVLLAPIWSMTVISSRRTSPSSRCSSMS